MRHLDEAGQGWLVQSLELMRSFTVRSLIPRLISAPVFMFRSGQGWSFKALPARTYPCILLPPSSRGCQCYFPAVTENFVQGSETTYQSVRSPWCLAPSWSAIDPASVQMSSLPTMLLLTQP